VRALEIDDELADAHASLALIRASYDWDWEGAETEFQRALGIDQKHVKMHSAPPRFFATMMQENAMQDPTIEVSLSI